MFSDHVITAFRSAHTDALFSHFSAFPLPLFPLSMLAYLKTDVVFWSVDTFHYFFGPHSTLNTFLNDDWNKFIECRDIQIQNWDTFKWNPQKFLRSAVWTVSVRRKKKKMRRQPKMSGKIMMKCLQLHFNYILAYAEALLTHTKFLFGKLRSDVDEMISF